MSKAGWSRRFHAPQRYSSPHRYLTPPFPSQPLLPPPDEQGMVVATDTAFMSTSRVRGTPLAYMGQGENVLWELQPRR
jgi:hypothetical protein